MGVELEQYWGIGPKTRAKFERELGIERSQKAILEADFDVLLSTDVKLGRVVSILRRIGEGKNIDAMGSVDSREKYNEILRIVEKFSVSSRVKNKIKIIAPISSVGIINEQLDLIFDTVEAWKLIPEKDQEVILRWLKRCDNRREMGRAVVGMVEFLHDKGSLGGVFKSVENIDSDLLHKISTSMEQMRGEFIREDIGDMDILFQMGEEDVYQILEEIREKNINNFVEFKEEVYRCLAIKTGIENSLIRNVQVEDSTEADEFIIEVVRKLKNKFIAENDEYERKRNVKNKEFIEDSMEEINKYVQIVDEIGLYLSLAHFSLFFNMSKPIVREDNPYVKIKKGRNLSMVNLADGEIKPIDYVIGVLESSDQTDIKRISLLTGGIGSGKTTLLDTIFNITTLANMGLPVPAEHAEVSIFDSIILQKCPGKRNSKDLKEMLRSMIPPIVEGKKTLLLIDEIEMATGIRDAPAILRWILDLVVKKGSIGVFSTHIARSIIPVKCGVKVEGIRDGAEGEYQPMQDIIARPMIELVVEDLISSTKKKL